MTLFDRTMRPPAMTAAAVAIVKPARQILALAETIRETVQDRAALAGRLALGAISTATLGLLPDGLIAIGRRYPEIRIKIEVGLSEALIEHVRAGALDAAIVTEPQTLPAGLACTAILHERLAIVSSVSGRGPPTLAGLADHPFIRFDRRVGVGQIIDRYRRAAACIRTSSWSSIRWRPSWSWSSAAWAWRSSRNTASQTCIDGGCWYRRSTSRTRCGGYPSSTGRSRRRRHSWKPCWRRSTPPPWAASFIINGDEVIYVSSSGLLNMLRGCRIAQQGTGLPCRWV